MLQCDAAWENVAEGMNDRSEPVVRKQGWSIVLTTEAGRYLSSIYVWKCLSYSIYKNVHTFQPSDTLRAFLRSE